MAPIIANRDGACWLACCCSGGMTAATIRPVEPGDLDALYDICLRTGDAGEDASAVFTDPRLLGHLFVAPYAVLEPRLAFVAVDDEGVGGYVVGTADTRAFEARLEAEWYPPLRARHPDGTGEGFDAMLVALLHHPMRADDAIVATHPAHLHIDLLPRLQGAGLGGRLMAAIHAACRAEGARGMHLGVSPRNARALGFYRHLGYEVLHEDPITVTMGLLL
jgi:GNAT superfamily N-acetyltransferase